MLTSRLKNILVTLLIIVFLALALYLGFSTGYRFIRNQDARSRLADQASRDEKLAPPTMINEDGLSIELTPTPVPEEFEGLESPRHIRQDTPGAIEIFIESGWGSEEIADALIEKEIIEDKMPFIIMAKLNGFDGSYQMGTHFVLKGMDFNEIMYNLSLPGETTTITVIEGLSYVDIKNNLREAGVKFDEKELDRLVNSPSTFSDYDLVKDIPLEGMDDRYFALEGYLFPDTYNFDLNVSEEAIIRTFLNNAERRIDEKLRKRAEAVGMSMYEVLTLASIIQDETGMPVDMYKISRVFHNRLDHDWLIQSDTTNNYIRQMMGKEKTIFITNEDMELDNPYNTYFYAGLPLGPIGNPGLEAIQSALYPDTDETNIWYFVADGQGNSIFASTLAEHEANIAKYSDSWSD